jgi:ATP/maltotriose-dependent transcriptional regulator MalT
MEGTRQAVIAKIVQWIDGGSDRPICWLSGPAGSGKSAIAQTVAERCAEKNRLGASFFLRGVGHRSDFTRFLRTLVYRLACFSPSTRQHIQNVLQNDPLIVNGAFADQFQKLMIDPLPNLAFPLVIVIDALDECDDKDSITNLIQVLLTHSSRGDHIPYRFLMTSRVEEHIRSEFEVSVGRVHPAVYPLALQEFSANDDIRLYLRSRFAKENIV